MKRIDIIKQSKLYAIGYEQGKQDTINKALKFVEEESKFIAHNSVDMLLDRLVKALKEM